MIFYFLFQKKFSIWVFHLHAYFFFYHMHAWYPQKPEESHRSPENGVIDGWEPQHLGARNQTCILWKNSKSFC